MDFVKIYSGIVTPGVSSVPEPLTLSLFAAGLAGAAAIRRKRRAAEV